MDIVGDTRLLAVDAVWSEPLGNTLRGTRLLAACAAAVSAVEAVEIETAPRLLLLPPAPAAAPAPAGSPPHY